MDCALWTRSAVQDLIKELYAIDMPIRTVGHDHSGASLHKNQ